MTDTGSLQQQHATANGAATATADGAATSPWLQRASSASLKRRTGCFLIGIAGGTASGKTTVCHKIMDRLQDQCARLIHQDSFYRGLTPEELRNVKCECWQLAGAGSSVHACSVALTAQHWEKRAWVCAGAEQVALSCTDRVQAALWCVVCCFARPVPVSSCCSDYNFDHPDAFDHSGLLQCLTDLKVSTCMFPKKKFNAGLRHRACCSGGQGQQRANMQQAWMGDGMQQLAVCTSPSSSCAQIRPDRASCCCCCHTFAAGWQVCGCACV